MFTGIIEDLGIVKGLVKENDNLHLTIQSVLAPELKVDQSVSHNGVCLTVIALTESDYTVTAIKETLDKTNINALKLGATVNLERGLKLGARLDGHMVQGHVDQVGIHENSDNRQSRVMGISQHERGKYRLQKDAQYICDHFCLVCSLSNYKLNNFVFR